MGRRSVSISACAVVVAAAGTSRSLGGSPFPPIFNLSTLNGTNGFTINGIDVNDASGRVVCGVGDINGDGIADVVVGAPYAAGGGDAGAGETYVVFGKHTATSGNFAASINLSALSGVNGFMITGLDVNDFSGIGAGRAGDVNGDGVDDLIIGASSADPNGQNNAGEAYVVFGKKTSVAGQFPAVFPLTSLNGTNGFVMNGIDPDDRAGRAVSGAGDINGDGVDDVVIGALEGDPGGLSNAGEAYIVFGKKVSVAGPFGASLNLSALNGTNGFAVVGEDAGGILGCAVGRAGDVNGDGLDDIALGAAGTNTYYDVDGGRVYIVFGRNTANDGLFPASVSLVVPGGLTTEVDGFEVGQRIGVSVSEADDINGDGLSDLIIGAPYAKYGAVTSGVVFAIFNDDGIGGSPSSLDGSNGITVYGGAQFDSTGNSVSSCDLNGDGVSDVIVGAPGADPAGKSAAGRTYIIFGRHTDAAGDFSPYAFPYLSSFPAYFDRWFQFAGIDPDDLSGTSVSSAGDVNGDGIDDVIIGARSADPNGQSGAGESYVVFGQPNQVWTGPGGGGWDTPGKWMSGVTPRNGVVVITPQVGVTITAPNTDLELRRLTMGATTGRTRVVLQAQTFLSIDGGFSMGATAGLGGPGTVVVESVMSSSGVIEPDGMTITAGGGVLNSGLIDISPASPSSPKATLDVFGLVTNAASGDILMRFGTTELGAWGGLSNHGLVSIVMADATIFGNVTNVNGIDIADAYALFTDNIVNTGTITLDADSAMTVVGTLSGNGVLGVSGPGSGGDVFVGGGVRPGQSAGIARFDGDLDLGGAGVSRIEIGGTSPGTGHDQIRVAGVVNAGGTLEISTINGFNPPAPSQFRVLEFGSAVGSFESIQLDSVLIAKHASTATLLIDGYIRIPAPGCVGDVNGDGRTNVTDFNILASNFKKGPGAARSEGDLTGDGFVNVLDFNVLAGDFRCGV